MNVTECYCVVLCTKSVFFGCRKWKRDHSDLGYCHVNTILMANIYPKMLIKFILRIPISQTHKAHVHFKVLLLYWPQKASNPSHLLHNNWHCDEVNNCAIYSLNWFEPRNQRPTLNDEVKLLTSNVAIFSRHEEIIFKENRFSQNIFWNSYDNVDWNAEQAKKTWVIGPNTSNWTLNDVRVGDLLIKKRSYCSISIIYTKYKGWTRIMKYSRHNMSVRQTGDHFLFVLLLDSFLF